MAAAVMTKDVNLEGPYAQQEVSTKEAVEAQLKKLKVKALALKTQTVALVRDPAFQTCTLSTAGGAVTLGTAGGAFGLASGVVAGAATGVIPALFTFGLSIPVGAIMGGGTGLCLGGATGATAGGATGFGAYKYRVEIKDGLLFVKKKACNTAEQSVVLVKTKADSAVTLTKKTASGAVALASDTTGKVAAATKAKSAKAYELATTTRAGVTATGAAAGGVLGGTAGATVGTVTGAAIGLIPALFTFGLSIPVGAAVGCCAGSVTGSGAGAVGGGVVGFSGFTYRKELSSGAEKASSGANAAMEAAKAKASAAMGAVKSKLAFRPAPAADTGAA